MSGASPWNREQKITELITELIQQQIYIDPAPLNKGVGVDRIVYLCYPFIESKKQEVLK